MVCGTEEERRGEESREEVDGREQAISRSESRLEAGAKGLSTVACLPLFGQNTSDTVRLNCSEGGRHEVGVMKSARALLLRKIMAGKTEVR